MKEIYKKIGERVRELRKRENLTQEALARESGFQQSIISDIERGDRRLELSFLLWFSNRFNCPLGDLVYGSDGVVKKEICPESSGRVDEVEASRVPLVICESQYCEGSECELKTDDFIQVPRQFLCSDNLVAVAVKGSANEPIIDPQAIVGVDLNDKVLVSGNFFAVAFSTEGIVIKKAFAAPGGKVLLTTEDRRAAPEFFVTMDEWGKIVLGRVKWVFQYLCP